MKNKITTLILVMFCSLASMAQVGIGTNSPNANAALEIASTSQGMLLPRMDAQQRNAINSPAEGLTIFNTTESTIQTNTGTSSSPSWENWYDGGAQLGATYTGFYNGIISSVHSTTTTDPTYFGLSTYISGETFSTNSSCTAKLISAQGCDGLTTVTGASGTVYALANINGQCWMTTNLNEVPSAYSTASGGIGTGAAWTTSSLGDLGYWGYYNITTASGASGWQSSVPGTGEGLLYQWSAAMNDSTAEREQGACPSGFHIPSDCEWMYLEHGQGMSITEQLVISSVAARANTADNQGTIGYKLRSEGIGQTNTSGFAGLLAGFRFASGAFSSRTFYGYWWSSSATASTTAIRRNLLTDDRGVARVNNNKAAAFSVRCLKD
jgi:uncharacterized protein (TIGR02145 family)